MARRSRRGGRRQGQTGKAYANRSDLNTAAPPGTAATPAHGPDPFGNQAAAQRAQQIIPVQPPPQPGSFGALDRPSERPGEPITEGMAMGAGRGPEVLPVPIGENRVVDELRAIFAVNPTPALAEMLRRAQMRRR